MQDTKLVKIEGLEFLDDELYVEAVYVAYDLIDISEKLLEALMLSDFTLDMPYGTMKARDGDPYEWVYQRLTELFHDDGDDL